MGVLKAKPDYRWLSTTLLYGRLRIVKAKPAGTLRVAFTILRLQRLVCRL